MSQEHSSTSGLADSEFAEAFNASLYEAAGARRELMGLMGEVPGRTRELRQGRCHGHSRLNGWEKESSLKVHNRLRRSLHGWSKNRKTARPIRRALSTQQK